MVIRFSRKFAKQYDKAPEKIKKAVQKRLKVFEQDINHPILKNHLLKGKFKGLRSINITGDWRAIYQEIVFKKETYFITLGTHSQLYK